VYVLVRARVYIYIYIKCNFNNYNVIFLQHDMQKFGQIGFPSVKERICNSTTYGHGCNRPLRDTDTHVTVRLMVMVVTDRSQTQTHM
jgi:hypothetical protein